jgi:hypothetical protein
MGLLPEVARDIGVSIPQAGHVISAYALGVVIGAPVLAVLAAGWRRRALLIALMACSRPATSPAPMAPDLPVAEPAALCHRPAARHLLRRGRAGGRHARAAGATRARRGAGDAGAHRRHAGRRAHCRMAGPALRLARGLRVRRRDRAGGRGAAAPRYARPRTPGRRQPLARTRRAQAQAGVVHAGHRRHRLRRHVLGVQLHQAHAHRGGRHAAGRRAPRAGAVRPGHGHGQPGGLAPGRQVAHAHHRRPAGVRGAGARAVHLRGAQRGTRRPSTCSSSAPPWPSARRCRSA